MSFVAARFYWANCVAFIVRSLKQNEILFLGGAKQNDGKNGVSMFKVIFGTKLKVNSLLCTGKTEFSVARKKCQMRNKLRKKTLDQ